MSSRARLRRSFAEILRFASTCGAKRGARPAKRRSRALVAAAFVFALLASARPAHAEDNGPLGAVIAFAVAGGMGIGSLPLWALRDDDAPIGLGVAFGSDLARGSFVMTEELSGDAGFDRPWSWSSRARAEFWSLEEDEPLEGAMRFDVLGGALLAGSVSGPAALEVIGGTTIWVSADDRDESGRAEPYGAFGPSVGLRFRSTTSVFRARVEASYVPLFGEAPTRHLHHFDLTTELGVAPGMPWGIPVVFEASLKRELGLGGDADTYEGTTITFGVELSFDRSLADPSVVE
jgi:hypothetical protein